MNELTKADLWCCKDWDDFKAFMVKNAVECLAFRVQSKYQVLVNITPCGGSNMNKAIYQFNWDCGRMGDVVGLFVAPVGVVEKSIGKSVYFGEILGKHSEIFGTLDEEDLQVLSDDQDFIAKFEEIMGSGTISGYNPLEYIDEDDE